MKSLGGPGTWLGVLVIVGQGKKQGHLNLITAVILLFDVGFKIGATVFCEIYDLWFVPWRQRRRQRAAETRRAEERRQAATEGGEREQVELALAVGPPRLSAEEQQNHQEEATGEIERRREMATEQGQQLGQQREATLGDADSALEYGSSEQESESV